MGASRAFCARPDEPMHRPHESCFWCAGSTPAGGVGVGGPAARPVATAAAQNDLGARYAGGLSSVRATAGFAKGYANPTDRETTRQRERRMKMMQIETKLGRAEAEAAELLVLTHCEGESLSKPDGSGLDKALGGSLRDLLQSREFEGRAGEVLVYHTHGKVPARRLLLVGLGKKRQ